MRRSLIFPLLLLAAGNAVAWECAPSSLSPPDQAARFQSLDRSAQSAFDRGDHAAAIRAYQDMICVAPESARAYYGLGGAQAAAGHLPAAREAFTKAAVLLPDSSLPLAMLVRVDVARNDIDSVKSVLRTAAAKFPKDAALHAGLSRFLAEKQQLDLALAEALRFEQTGSNDPEGLAALAVLEHMAGAFDDAIRHSLAVVASDAPDAVKATAAGVAGLSYESVGDRDSAVTQLQTATRLAPKRITSWLALASLYEKQQKYEEAVRVLDDASQHVDNRLELELSLGNNLVWAGLLDRGIPVLEELIKRHPATEEAYLRLAEARRRQGNTAEEVTALQRLGKINPAYPMLHVLIAQAHLRSDSPDYTVAVQELNQAAHATPADPDVYYLQGKTLLALAQYDQAAIALQHAIQLNPLEPGPYYQLGLLYRKSGRPELAGKWFERTAHLQQRQR